jgi:hypothetical protein
LFVGFDFLDVRSHPVENDLSWSSHHVKLLACVSFVPHAEVIKISTRILFWVNDEVFFLELQIIWWEVSILAVLILELAVLHVLNCPKLSNFNAFWNHRLLHVHIESWCSTLGLEDDAA